MKANRIFAAICVAVSFSLFIAIFTAIHTTEKSGRAYGNVASGMPVFGNTQLVVAGTSALNLSGTASTSIPCNNVLIYASTTGCTVGSTSASATFPLTTGLQSIPFPATNVNQIWAQVSSGTVTVNTCYAQ